jgi:predicted acyl esterase
VFALGSGEWKEFSSWPPSGATTETWPLGRPATFQVNPPDLPPALGGRGILVGVPGGGWGPVDQRSLAARKDTASFEFDVDQPIFLAGPVRLDLAVEARGGDRRQWTAVLARYASDGALDAITEGVAWADTAATSVSIPVGDVCLQLDRGDRIAVIVAGGSVPRWEPVTTSGVQGILEGSTLSFHRLRNA